PRARLAANPIGVAAHADPGVDERPGEPGPDRALMVSLVALFLTAAVIATILRVLRRERAQTHWRPELLFHGINQSSGVVAAEELIRQSAHGKDLIRPERGVVHATLRIDVDDVVAPAHILTPEPLRERDPRALECFHPHRAPRGIQIR